PATYHLQSRRFATGFFFKFVRMIYLMAHADALPDSFPELCRAFMPSERIQKMMSYTRLADRKLCAAAYVLLVHALKREGLFTQLPVFGYGPNNKPYLANYNGIHFNISHCPGAVVCALSPDPVGIDIEKVVAYDNQMARYICNPKEYDWVTEIPGREAQRFTEMWTRKESYVKSLGTGIDCHPRDMKSGESRVFYTGNNNNQYIISLRQCSNKHTP
ncbi:MAG TPA: 4'-phosphopantetheinyl transferase superfamily protein, partial [Bacteroidales bacterium]|nr:4'-phosphopantetheinyl transferase superfamily protein [Bacteroidales bacterium]